MGNLPRGGGKLPCLEKQHQILSKQWLGDLSPRERNRPKLFRQCQCKKFLLSETSYKEGVENTTQRESNWAHSKVENWFLENIKTNANYKPNCWLLSTQRTVGGGGLEAKAPSLELQNWTRNSAERCGMLAFSFFPQGYRFLRGNHWGFAFDSKSLKSSAAERERKRVRSTSNQTQRGLRFSLLRTAKILCLWGVAVWQAAVFSFQSCGKWGRTGLNSANFTPRS